MKSITTRFVTSNIISSVILISSIPILQKQNRSFFEGTEMFISLFSFLLLTLGHYACLYNSKVIATNQSKPSLNRFEKVFLGIIFFFGVTSIMMTMMSFSNVFGDDPEAHPVWVKIFTVVLTLILFVFIVLEPMILFGTIDVKPKKESKWMNILVYLYVSIGISIGWDMLIIGSKVSLDFDQSNIISELLAVIVLALMLFFPFQRLFWYEVMSHSKDKKENLKVFASVLLVLCSAIVPLFFK